MTNKEIETWLRQILDYIDAEPTPQGHQDHWSEANRLSDALDEVYAMVEELVLEVQK